MLNMNTLHQIMKENKHLSIFDIDLLLQGKDNDQDYLVHSTHHRQLDFNDKVYNCELEFQNRMCRLAKQKSNKANWLNLYPQQRVILEKGINYKT